MDTQKVKREYRLQQWSELVRLCRSSGQKVSVWCAENNINPKRYYYWLRRVRIAACETLPTSSNQERPIVPIPLTTSFVSNSTMESSAPIIIRMGSASVEVHHGASPELISHTIKALSYAR